MIKRIIGYFLGGLALVLPLVLTAWLLYYFYTLVKGYSDVKYAGIGLAVVIIGLIIVGFIASSYIGGRLFSGLQSILVKTPILGTVYKSAKDVTLAFVGTENKFSEAVLIEFHDEIYKIGFVTNKDLQDLHTIDDDQGEDLYAVYFPLSFSLSGDLFLISKNKIKAIDGKAKEAMQMIVSGGMIKTEYKEVT
jgi:uncharacterized membrane protein